MTVAPVRPDIPEANVSRETTVTRWPKMTTLVAMVLAAVLYAIGWLVGLLSIPCNWCMGALRVGWNDARRRGGI